VTAAQGMVSATWSKRESDVIVGDASANNPFKTLASIVDDRNSVHLTGRMANIQMKI
jgi:hypothetical protein